MCCVLLLPSVSWSDAPAAHNRDDFALHITAAYAPVIPAVVAVGAEVAQKEVAVLRYVVGIGDIGPGYQVSRIEDFFTDNVAIDQ